VSDGSNFFSGWKGPLLLAAVLGVLVVLAGCAAPKKHWVHATVPEAEWQLDIQLCASKARRAAQKGAEESLASPSSSGSIDTPSIIDQAAMQRYEKKDRKTLIAQCLRKLGYRQVPK